MSNSGSVQVKTAIISAISAVAVAGLTAFATIKANELNVRSKINAATSQAESTIKELTQAESTIEELRTQIKGLKSQLPASLVWERARLKKGWSIYEHGYSDPSYAKDILGFVHLRGIAEGGKTGKGNLLMLLPEGFRPEHRMDIIVSCYGESPCEVVIEPEGEVWFEILDFRWVSLDNISFEASR